MPASEEATNLPDVKEYRTSDMYLAAFLMLAKCEFLRSERDDDPRSNRSFFVFAEGINHDRLVSEYFNGKGLVPANEFAAKLRDVKTITHSGRRR